MEHYIWLALTTLATAFVGSFLGGYLRKKGENLATHEDVKQLVAQVSAVTQATKEIEAKISGEEWKKQKLWEERKEAYVRAVSELAALRAATMNMIGLHKLAHEHGFGSNTWDSYQGAVSKYQETGQTFERASISARIVGSADVSARLLRIRTKMGEFHTLMLIKQDITEMFLEIRDVVKEAVELDQVIRYELGVDSVMPQSTESSATLIPDLPGLVADMSARRKDRHETPPQG